MVFLCSPSTRFTSTPPSSPPSGSGAKPVNENCAEVAAVSSPSKSQPEGHRPSAGEPNGLISASEETRPATPESATQAVPAVPPKGLPGKPATAAQEPPKEPASPQEGQLPPTPAVSPPPRLEAPRPPCLPTNGCSWDSTETSVLSPSPRSDSPRLEDALDGTSSLVSETLTPEESADIGVNVQVQESPLPNTDSVKHGGGGGGGGTIVGDGKGDESHKASHSGETVKQDEGPDEQKCIVVKSSATTLDEGIKGCDVPDGLESDDFPSVSEAEPLSLNAKPKRQRSIFKGNKKKSNQGNSSIHLNKDHVWNASLSMCVNGKHRRAVLFFTVFNILYCMYGLSWYL